MTQNVCAVEVVVGDGELAIAQRSYLRRQDLERILPVPLFTPLFDWQMHVFLVRSHSLVSAFDLGRSGSMGRPQVRVESQRPAATGKTNTTPPDWRD